MLFRTLCCLTALTVFSANVQADILIDDFATPASGAHNSDGSTVTLEAPPNFFQERENDGDAASNISITNGAISTAIPVGQSAYLSYTSATSTKTLGKHLILHNFNGTSLAGSTYDVSIDGSSISNGPQQLTSGLLRITGGNVVSPESELRITFATVGQSGITVFQSSHLTASPEPTAIGLLGLAMFGGACRYRRRRTV